MNRGIFCWDPTEEGVLSFMPADRFDVLHGSLALMVLRTLDTLGPLHGYGLARRIEQMSGDQVALNQGTLYPALLKLEQVGWITSSWGASDNNRRARFYAISRAGRKQLKAEAEKWSKTSQIVARFINPSENLA
jgi:PadR family transcriptional regulator PadR